jgi:2-methylaconitate cis-trans-isomerase PrpF
MRGGTSKGVLLSRSERPDSDVDYRFGAVAVQQPLIDWSGNCGNLSAAGVPMQDGEVLEEGDFELDGVTFPAAEIELRFLDPAGEGTLLPTGALTNQLLVPGVGALEVTLLNAGIASVFVAAEALGLRGTESQAELNAQPQLLAQVEAVRAAAAVAMGLAATPAEATAQRPCPAPWCSVWRCCVSRASFVWRIPAAHARVRVAQA